MSEETRLNSTYFFFGNAVAGHFGARCLPREGVRGARHGYFLANRSRNTFQPVIQLRQVQLGRVQRTAASPKIDCRRKKEAAAEFFFFQFPFLKGALKGGLIPCS